MASRRHISPSAPPLDDDDLLAEILLRLPPQPSSLPRASAVCKRWALLVSNPRFLRRFRRHHRRNPPLLGIFDGDQELFFLPTLEAPNRIPPRRFSLQRGDGGGGDGRFIRFCSHGCRHGLVLIFDRMQLCFLVWEPVTGHLHRLAFPPGFDAEETLINGAVLRAAGDDRYQVVLVVAADDDKQQRRAFACVYSSETRVCGDLISAPIPSEVPNIRPNTLSRKPALLVGDSLYWMLTGSLSSILEPPEGQILEFDLERQSLAVIPLPLDRYEFKEDNCTVMRAEGGRLGFLSVSEFTARLWKRKTTSDGVDSWVLGRTIELDKLLSLDAGDNSMLPLICGFAETNNVVFLGTDAGLFMLYLESLQFKNLPTIDILSYYHPFESFYAAETGIGDGDDAADLLHNR